MRITSGIVWTAILIMNIVQKVIDKPIVAIIRMIQSGQ
jgi:hypothetical protein